MGRMRSNESQSILKYTLLQESNSPGIGLRLDIGRPVLCHAQTHGVLKSILSLYSVLGLEIIEISV